MAAKTQTLEGAPTLPMTEAAYLPGVAYDEMFTPQGEVRRHYDPLHARMSTLGAEELVGRQRTLERSFLLQGIIAINGSVRRRRPTGHAARHSGCLTARCW